MVLESAGDALEDFVLHAEQGVLARVSAPGREPRVATPTEAVGVREVPLGRSAFAASKLVKTVLAPPLHWRNGST